MSGDFWKRHNPNVAKALAIGGVPTSFLARNWYLDVEGLLDTTKAATALANAFRSTHLGDVEVRKGVVRCVLSRDCMLWGLVLAREVLREVEAPSECTIRSGYPEPQTPYRVYKVDRKSNLEQIGRGSRKRPASGEVFAYSFDKNLYHFGLVVRDSVEGAWDTPLIMAYFVRHSITSPGMPNDVDYGRVLIPPLLVDNGCWQRGLFLKVGSVDLSEIRLADYCFEMKGVMPGSTSLFLDERGKPRVRADVCASWAFCPWSSVDAELSKAHDVPLLA